MRLWFWVVVFAVLTSCALGPTTVSESDLSVLERSFQFERMNRPVKFTADTVVFDVRSFFDYQIERMLAICLHLALSLMVMQVFTRRRSIWLLAAILWHALANAMVVIAVTTWGVCASEGLLAVFALISLGIIYWLKEPEPQEPDIDPLPLPLAGEDTQAAVTLDMLERSRYT